MSLYELWERLEDKAFEGELTRADWDELVRAFDAEVPSEQKADRWESVVEFGAMHGVIDPDEDAAALSR